jgi:hypothetical protein
MAITKTFQARVSEAKTKRAAFAGRHVQAFYARGGCCQSPRSRQSALQSAGTPHHSSVVEKPDFNPQMSEHVDALTRTLAPESRHIVASEL